MDVLNLRHSPSCSRCYFDDGRGNQWQFIIEALNCQRRRGDDRDRGDRIHKKRGPWKRVRRMDRGVSSLFSASEHEGGLKKNMSAPGSAPVLTGVMVPSVQILSYLVPKSSTPLGRNKSVDLFVAVTS